MPSAPPPPARLTTARRWLGRAALFSGSGAFAILAAELTLRALGIMPDRYMQPRFVEADDKRIALDLYPDDPRGEFPLDLRDEDERRRWIDRGLSEVAERWERTPHAVPFRFTEELCRGEPFGEAPSDRPRVVVMGDSFTEGQGVVEERTYAARLARALPDAEVLNCGRRGYDFPDLRRRFEEHLALRPDVVIYAMVLNDPQRSEAFSARQRYLDDWILARRRMVTSGDGAPAPGEPWLWSLARDRLEGLRVGAETTRWYRQMVSDDNRAGWSATLEHIVAMDAAMRARGGRFVVVLWPLLVELGEGYPFVEVHRIIGRALRERGVRFHDALDAFRGRDASRLWVHPADRHPNERAHALFAEQVRPLLEAALRAPGEAS